MMKNKRLPTARSALVLSAACAVLAGCAVTGQEVETKVTGAEDQIKTIQKAAIDARTAQDPPFLRIRGNWLGSTSMPVSAGMSLPQQFRNVSLNFGRAEGPFVAAIRNVRSATGLTVRLDSDIYTNLAVAPGTQSQQTPMAMAAAAPAAALASPVPLPGGPLPTGGMAAIGNHQPNGMLLQQPAAPSQIPAQTQVPFSYSGDLSDYLNMICGTAGLNWEYENGEIHIYRLVTRSFSVELSPRTIDVSDLTSGGGQTSLSSGGGSGSGSGGSGSSSTTSTSTSNLISKFDPWNDFAAAVRGQLSPWGKISTNTSTGTFVVTDTKAVVDRVATFIAAENAKLMTKIDIEIRTISLSLNDGAQAGMNLDLVYSALGASGAAGNNWGLVFAPPSSATTGTSGTTAGTGTFTYSKPGSRFAGSAVTLQGLNTFGKVVSDSSQTIQARNRVPSQYQNVTDFPYLAATTPAAGGGTSGGQGVPGLTPGLVSYGTFLTVTPSVSDNGTVTVSLSDTASNLVDVKSAQTGTGATFQQITLPILNRTKTASDLVIPKGASAISVGSFGDSWNSTSNVGIGGASANRTHSKVITILVVTPHVYPAN